MKKIEIRKGIIILSTLLIVAGLVTGCCSIIHGTSQEIGVGSNPTGAKVFVNGMGKGKTPLVMDLKRKNSHIIKIELEGYEPFETTIIKSVSLDSHRANSR